MSAAVRPRRRSDIGSASVLVVAVLAVVFFAGMVAVAVTEVSVARHRAGAAADLAAVAAAAVWPARPRVMCAQAAAVAVRNRATLEGCSADGATGEAAVSVRVTLRALGVVHGHAHASRSRPAAAGP